MHKIYGEYNIVERTAQVNGVSFSGVEDAHISDDGETYQAIAFNSKLLSFEYIYWDVVNPEAELSEDQCSWEECHIYKI